MSHRRADTKMTRKELVVLTLLCKGHGNVVREWRPLFVSHSRLAIGSLVDRGYVEQRFLLTGIDQVCGVEYRLTVSGRQVAMMITRLEKLGRGVEVIA